jgi:hypothetical protein
VGRLIEGRFAVGSAGRAEDRQAAVQIVITQLAQLRSQAGDGRQSGKALLRVVVVGIDVFAHQGVEQLQPFGRQLSLVEQDLPQRS